MEIPAKQTVGRLAILVGRTRLISVPSCGLARIFCPHDSFSPTFAYGLVKGDSGKRGFSQDLRIG
jgi:hypothetical protein